MKTSSDNQPVVLNEVNKTKINQLLGKFELGHPHLPPTTSCVPAQIAVVFDIDARGVLHMSLVDKSTGKEQEDKEEKYKDKSVFQELNMNATVHTKATVEDEKCRSRIDNENGHAMK
ncbi:hypothetical protein HPG69_010890 [Diceros bicornis minor]|uniref:Uncharacterized protein n=1 Tax=Diceros bicornis minor TaxID=77932 RepID=A0A7J7EGT3_DICBM|nr:hypothetical protein HPG69_010890 [Diceros bicornis minor]